MNEKEKDERIDELVRKNSLMRDWVKKQGKMLEDFNEAMEKSTEQLKEITKDE